MKNYDYRLHSAFFGCAKLNSITFNGNWTKIPDGMFIYCTGLTSITLPNTITEIGIYAFARCENLESITIRNIAVFSIYTIIFLIVSIIVFNKKMISDNK